jgi:hypothetical protein
MDLQRTPLLLSETAVPVNWPSRTGYPSPGVTRKTAYPAGGGNSKGDAGYDDEYPCTDEGKKLAKAHAWQFPSKRIKVCGKILRY